MRLVGITMGLGGKALRLAEMRLAGMGPRLVGMALKVARIALKLVSLAQRLVVRVM